MPNFLNTDGDIVTSARDDGTGKPVTDVQLTGSIVENGFNKKLAFIATTLEPGNNQAIDINKSIIIDSLVVDANNNNLQFEMQFRNRNGLFEDRERTSISPGSISTLPRLRQCRHTHPFIESVVYDDQENRYIFKLREKQRFPFGIRFMVQSPPSPQPTANIAVTLAVHYRITEVE
ncbi:hypothetical protein [Alteribacter populi]|uniref:hypothetical protein n=1 Tax=Alteribacter populi TaxID=2011011 RepID=UPI000BBAC5CD|nr:hypothetical protein [Alteribacter populi]